MMIAKVLVTHKGTNEPHPWMAYGQDADGNNVLLPNGFLLHAHEATVEEAIKAYITMAIDAGFAFHKEQ